MQRICNVGVRTFGLPSPRFASKFALISIVAICLLISPFVVSASYGTSSAGINSTKISPDVHQLTLTSPNAQTYGRFSWSVAVSGKTVLVGAPAENASGYQYAGHAYIFNASTGNLISTLTSPKPQSGTDFGLSVAVSGNAVVVGAPFENNNAGRAYVFNASTGKLIRTLKIPHHRGYFGSSVAVSGNTIVVGAQVAAASGYGRAGHAYVFNASTGALIRTLTSANAQWEGWFGSSAAISGNTVVVGALGETASGYKEAGHAYIFLP